MKTPLLLILASIIIIVWYIAMKLINVWRIAQLIVKYRDELYPDTIADLESITASLTTQERRRVEFLMTNKKWGSLRHWLNNYLRDHNSQFNLD